VLEQETGSVTTADLEHMMGLVVNDHDEDVSLHAKEQRRSRRLGFIASCVERLRSRVLTLAPRSAGRRP